MINQLEIVIIAIVLLQNGISGDIAQNNSEIVDKHEIIENQEGANMTVDQNNNNTVVNDTTQEQEEEENDSYIKISEDTLIILVVVTFILGILYCAIKFDIIVGVIVMILCVPISPMICIWYILNQYFRKPMQIFVERIIIIGKIAPEVLWRGTTSIVSIEIREKFLDKSEEMEQIQSDY